MTVKLRISKDWYITFTEVQYVKVILKDIEK